MRVRQWIEDTKTLSRFSRGIPSSSKLHNPAVIRAHREAADDWIQSRMQKAREKHEKDGVLDQSAYQRAIVSIRAVARRAMPWLRRIQ